jgi:3D (Asp-Asp-Asp) domain-containing protein
MAAGLLWIVSGGDASKVGQAKTMIAGSITGLLLLVSISLLLTYINPKLAQQGFVELTPIERKIIESLAVGRKNKTAQDYGKGCPTAAELSSSAGATIYATGYYKPLYNKNNKDFWCIIAMQCSCPKGVDTTKNCDNLYGKTFPNYHPCIEFDENTPYCNMTASGAEPQIGTIAGPSDCRGVLPMNSQVCFKGKTYTITDSGGGIKGRRIDIWSGNSLDAAYANTGVGQMTTGPCK